jgi:uncharacterized protein with von Willebrand factor type A (vWA) domain
VAEAESALGLVRKLFDQLRGRRFPLGPSDLQALRDALTAGFGWSSCEALRELIVSLWAKSSREAETVRALFTRLPWPENWLVEQVNRPPPTPTGVVVEPLSPGEAARVNEEIAKTVAPVAPAPVTRRVGTLPPLELERMRMSDAQLLFVEQYPVGGREVAQALRRLRRPLRFGPPIELDVHATIARSASAGICLPPVLVPARRNTSRLLLLIDVEGSMAPYRPLVQLFCESVLEGGWLQRVDFLYFHDLPVDGVSDPLLADLDPNALFPDLDAVVARIDGVAAGDVFADESMTKPVDLRQVLQEVDTQTVAMIVSDAGAARSRTQVSRFLDTLIFVKGLRSEVRSVVWLNPVPQALWKGSNAELLARHIPMFRLDRMGLERAVNVLRGQPARLERPL